MASGSLPKKVSGTREWAVAGVNCATGCRHDCRYCYARYASVVKRGETNRSGWRRMRAWSEGLERDYPRYPGTVMFPTEHDIHPSILPECLSVLEGLLRADNRVLVVSKPHLQCIAAICETFTDRRNQLLFRFTITAGDDDILAFWEPGAPPYQERLASLRLAREEGFATSVSIEPMLDSDTVEDLVRMLTPYVTHSIWLGKMNKIDRRVDCESAEMAHEIARIERSQSDERLHEIYSHLKDHPLVRWKESIKEVIGLPLATEPGQDM